MPQTIDKAEVLAYVRAIQSILDQAYTDGVRMAVPTDIQSNGTVAGVFLADNNDRFEFLIAEDEIRFKLMKDRPKLDSYSVGYLSKNQSIPVQFNGDDDYSSGFLEAWNRMDARPRKESTCTVGIACKGGCINRSKECRVKLSSPVTQKQIKTVLDAGKTLNAVAGTDLILPMLGAGAIALVGFSAGVSVGSYLGAAAATPPRQAAPKVETPPKPKTSKELENFPDKMPDYWKDADDSDAEVDLRPTEAMKRAAKRGLELRKAAPSSRKGGLSTKQASAEGVGSGVQRASNIINSETLTPSTWKRMKAFFDRHSAFKKNHTTDPPSKSYISWLLWGGDPAYARAKRVVAMLEKGSKDE